MTAFTARMTTAHEIAPDTANFLVGGDYDIADAAYAPVTMGRITLGETRVPDPGRSTSDARLPGGQP